MPVLLARWAAVIAVTVLSAFACDLAGLPSPQLFAGLIGASSRRWRSGGAWRCRGRCGRARRR